MKGDYIPIDDDYGTIGYYYQCPECGKRTPFVGCDEGCQYCGFSEPYVDPDDMDINSRLP